MDFDIKLVSDFDTILVMDFDINLVSDFDIILVMDFDIRWFHVLAKTARYRIIVWIKQNETPRLLGEKNE